MGTLCIYLNFKLIWPNLAKLRGGGAVVTGASLRCDMGGGERSFVSCVYYNFAWWSNTLGYEFKNIS